MELALGFVSILVGALISMVLTLLFSDRIKQGLMPLIMRLNSSEKRGIEGKWVATFSLSVDDNVSHFTEVIQINQSFGMVIGHIVPDPRNYEQLHSVEAQKPLRIRGELVDNRYLTGTWFHPIEIQRYHGAFQLLLSPSGDRMNGRWIGFSESMNQVDIGEWIWVRE
jgi:hypothetical protein